MKTNLSAQIVREARNLDEFMEAIARREKINYTTDSKLSGRHHYASSFTAPNGDYLVYAVKQTSPMLRIHARGVEIVIRRAKWGVHAYDIVNRLKDMFKDYEGYSTREYGWYQRFPSSGADGGCYEEAREMGGWHGEGV